METSHTCRVRVLSEPAFNHKTYGEAFYMVLLGILRRSGYEDRIRLIISEKLLGGRSPRIGEGWRWPARYGHTTKRWTAEPLEVTVFVRNMEYCRENEPVYENHVAIEGFICKPPVRRTSPLGREICDLMIAVNRMYNKSDYIPTIAWGRNAVYSGKLQVGNKVYVEGRIQSREYRKYTDEGEAITKTAYEVSVVTMEKVIQHRCGAEGE